MLKRISLLGVLALAALSWVSVPGFTSSADQKSGKMQYEDPRLGESKDNSDKFTFARVKYDGPVIPGEELGDHGPMWSHDYPDAGLHFAKIVAELSKLRVTLDTNEPIFRFDDPDLFKYPFVYLCEVGYMTLSDEEIKGMREYCLRGGFILVDDFRRPQQMQNFLYYVRQALPEFEMKELDITHPIFNCFYSIKTLNVKQPYDRGKPYFFAISDSHDRIMMIINYNNDISDFWQWSDNTVYPIDDTNEGYKFGVNDLFYALTH
jgi:hypothetical protein